MPSQTVARDPPVSPKSSGVVENRNDAPRAKVTPLPVVQLSILCVVLLTESICSTMLVPFVGYYVSFMMGWPVEKAGYAAGLLVGLFMLGQVISGKAWGVVADKAGRKIAIACGVFFCACAVCLFGLSTNMYMCAFWRFIHGLSAGCSLLAKTMISDITDHTNQAKGFALVSLTWGVGTLIGPSVGGFLYNPVDQSWLAPMGLSHDGFLAKHPAFLPSFAASMYNLFAVIICVAFLNETGRTARPLHKLLPSSIGRPLRPVLNLLQPKLPYYVPSDDEEDEETGSVGATCVSGRADGKRARDVSIVVLNGEEGAPTDAGCSARVASGIKGKGSPRESPPLGGSSTDRVEHDGGALAPQESAARATERNRPSGFGFAQAFADSNIRTVLVMSMLISASDMLYAEVFPLWAVVRRDHGGLGLTTSGVGVLVLVNSVPAVISNMCFAKAIQVVGDELKFWNISQLLYALFTAAIPVASAIHNDTSAYWYTMTFNMARKVVEAWAFGMIMLAVAQTAPLGKASIMYGIQQSTACMVRCFVPFTCAPLFAWSVASSHPFPLNQYLLFLIAVVPLVASVLYSSGLSLPSVKQDEHDNGAVIEADMPDAEGGRKGLANDSMDNESVRYTSASANQSFSSLHSFGASQHDSQRAPTLPLENSFASLAQSFATNIVPGLLNSTIMPPLTSRSSTAQDNPRSDTGAVDDSESATRRRSRSSSLSAGGSGLRRGSAHPGAHHHAVPSAHESGIIIAPREARGHLRRRGSRHSRSRSSSSVSMDSRDAPSQLSDDDGAERAEDGAELPSVAQSTAAQQTNTQPQTAGLSSSTAPTVRSDKQQSWTSVDEAARRSRGESGASHHHRASQLTQHFYDAPYQPQRSVEVVDCEDAREDVLDASEAEERLPSPTGNAP